MPSINELTKDGMMCYDKFVIKNLTNDMEELNMEQNIVFDIKATVTGVLAQKASETGIELNEESVNALVNNLIDSRVLEVNKLVDLGDFTHFSVRENETAPFKALLLNNKLVYLYEKTRTRRAHADAYEEYLDDNDLYDEDFPYDRFLRENELVETFPSETYVAIDSYVIGDILFNAIRDKENAEKTLETANRTLEKIKPVVGEHFLPIL